MKLDLLYKKTKKNQIQTWQIEIEGDKFRTHEGIQNGTITIAEWTTCTSQSVGRSNQTSPEEQALKEAQSKWQKKIDSGYVQDLKNIDQEKFFEPMLAFKYEDHKDSITFPCFVQLKLDGIRCIAKKDGLWSRNGKLITAVPHIFESLRDMFEKYPEIIFDGELYNHDLKDDFDKIISCVRKTKLTEKELKDSRDNIQYYIYDVYIGKIATFKERNKVLLQLIKSDLFLKLVDTYEVNSFEEADKYYDQFLFEGYEGIMYRINKPYENKRSKSLLKRKEHIDEEFEILDVCEGLGNRSGMAGYLTCKMEDGRTFNSNIKGGFEFYKELLINRENYISQKATIRFQNYTPDHFPRFPRCISIRNYE
jgi:DNA ligase 1